MSLSLLVALGAACSQTDFASQDHDTAAKRPDDSSGRDGDAGGNDGEDGSHDVDEGRNNSDGDVEIDNRELGSSDDGEGDGDIETTEDRINCDTDPVKDAAETFVFTRMEEIRTFVNQKCETSIPTDWTTQGAVRDDAVTQEKICRLKGFKRASAFTTRNWSSPGDNHMSWWEAGEKRFKLVSTSNGNNHWLGSLTCQERLHSKCSEETVKERCSY